MTEENLINELTERTGKLCKNKIVLAIQDTSEINLTSHRNRLKPNTGLGRVDDAKGNIGFKLHPTLAVDADTLHPFGLTMAGISSKAAGSLGNKYKFGGKELQSNEFSDNSGLELYDFQAKNYDPQLGRFWGGDEKADKFVNWSPYTYYLNNPLVFVDPDGEYPWPIWVRSFISASSGVAGGLFRGDGRGPS